MSDSSAKEIAKNVYSSGKTTGKIGKFRFLIEDSKDVKGKTAVFLDSSSEIMSYIRVLLLSGGIGIICWCGMLFLVIILSRKAISPIAENIERQKQFVTNAGHEIKTPLAIIQANADAMELYNGETKWGKNIREQIVRLNGLMNNMLTIAKMDENKSEKIISNFSLSDLTNKYLQSYSEPFLLKKIAIKTDIQRDIIISGNKEQISQLISILMDNTRKYTNENGLVIISLKKAGKKVSLQVKNTCEKIPEVPAEKLFDRFFRAEKARTQKLGGYGIGLSIAKSITENNNGKLLAKYEEPNFIIFTATFKYKHLKDL